MFAADESMMCCSMKSSVLGILEKLPHEMNISTDMVHLPAAEIPLENTKNVVLVDGMAEVQSVGKLDTIKTCSELADHFMQHVVKKYSKYVEIRLSFD